MSSQPVVVSKQSHPVALPVRSIVTSTHASPQFSNVIVQPSLIVPAPARSTYNIPIPSNYTLVTTDAPINSQLNPSECIAGLHVYASQYDALGVLLAVLLFPIGLLCCCSMYEMRCVKCNAVLRKQK